MQLLSEAVIELNISRKNVGIYPPGHIQIANSIERAFHILQQLFKIRQEMTLGVAEDTLLVGEDYLDQKNPAYRDFALSMNQQGIASVTFINGLDKKEIVRFNRILTTKPEDIRALGGINRVMAKVPISHIRIQSIDYGSFHATEEQEIFKTSSRDGKGQQSGSHLWQDFVTQLLAGTLAGPGQGVSLKHAEQIDPAELARLLNERKMDVNAAIESYDQIISTYVRGLAEKEPLNPEQSTTIAKTGALVKDLHPALRRQFLSVAFKNVAMGTAAHAEVEAVLGGFTDYMVIEMLEQASAEGREISPTLAALVSKLVQVRTDVPAEEQGKSKQLEKEFVDLASQAEDTRKLFDCEKYEKYVSDDYQTMLKRFSEDHMAAVGEFPLKEYLQSLEDGCLDLQIGRALLAFLEENIDEEDYREFAQKIVALMPQFLETGNFEILCDIVETVRRHSTDKPAAGIREIATETRMFFFAPDFIDKVIGTVDLSMQEKGEAASRLIQALGPDTIPGLMDMFSTEESVDGRPMLFHVLCLFGDPAVREAQKRLCDPRASTVRNMLILIGHAGSPASIPLIEPLMKHKDQMVKIEALNALIKFKYPGAVDLLREAMHDKNKDFAFQAIALAGKHRITDVAEDLVSRIKRIVLFESDYVEHEEIIRALGNIGDARVIPKLEKLARATWSLYPQSHMHMKKVIYKSLAQYPREKISGLLKIGKKLNNSQIRRTCRNLM